jgi:predicted amidohydrolase
MKAYIIQPYYSFNEGDLDICMSDMLAHLDSVGEDADLIVLPEYCDVPAACKGKQSFHASIEKYNDLIKEKAIDAARRCHSIVFFNAADKTPTGWRNTTYALDREGNLVGKYYKAHPAPSEVKTEREGGNELDVSYSYEFRQPDVIEIEGIRFGFMTCYDFYFYENFAPLARQNVDVIIGCSHQRTDTHEALAIINRFLCYNTNAYLVRSSVSLGPESDICGCSTIIAPDGRVLGEQAALTTGMVVADVYARQVQTPYSQLGYLFVWICFAAQAVLVLTQIAHAAIKCYKCRKSNNQT